MGATRKVLKIPGNAFQRRFPLPQLLLYNRKKSVEKGLRPKLEKAAMKGYQLASNNRFAYDNIPAFVKNISFAPFNYILWGPKRKMPTFATNSFSKQYKKLKK